MSVDELQRGVVAPQKEKMKPKVPPFTYTATSTKILMLPPPSPPSATSVNDKMSSAEEKNLDEKEDTSKEKEQVAI